MVGHSFLTKRRRPDLGKFTRRYAVQPLPANIIPDTEYEVAVKSTWNRIIREAIQI